MGHFDNEIADRRLCSKEAVELVDHSVVRVFPDFRTCFFNGLDADHRWSQFCHSERQARDKSCYIMCWRAQITAPHSGEWRGSSNSSPISRRMTGWLATEPLRD